MCYGLIKISILSCWRHSVWRHQLSSPWEKRQLPPLSPLQSLEHLVKCAGWASWVIFWKCLGTCNGYKKRQRTFGGNLLFSQCSCEFFGDVLSSAISTGLMTFIEDTYICKRARQLCCCSNWNRFWLNTAELLWLYFISTFASSVLIIFVSKAFGPSKWYLKTLQPWLGQRVNTEPKPSCSHGQCWRADMWGAWQPFVKQLSTVLSQHPSKLLRLKQEQTCVLRGHKGVLPTSSRTQVSLEEYTSFLLTPRSLEMSLIACLFALETSREAFLTRTSRPTE